MLKEAASLYSQEGMSFTDGGATAEKASNPAVAALTGLPGRREKSIQNITCSSLCLDLLIQI